MFEGAKSLLASFAELPNTLKFHFLKFPLWRADARYSISAVCFPNMKYSYPDSAVKATRRNQPYRQSIRIFYKFIGEMQEDAIRALPVDAPILKRSENLDNEPNSTYTFVDSDKGGANLLNK